MMFALIAAAQEAATWANHSWSDFGIALGVGLGMAIAVYGAASGQAKAIAASAEATARQPEAGGRIFVMMILGLAFIETLVLFTFLVLGIFLLGKFGPPHA